MDEQPDQVLIRAVAGQMELYPPGVAPDHGADLEQALSQPSRTRSSVAGVGERQAAQSGEQRVGETGDKQPELVRPPGLGTGAVGVEVELLVLDAVLHVTAGAVNLVVQGLGVAGEAGDDKAPVAPDAVVLGLGDQPAGALPRARLVGARTEQPHRLLAGEAVQRLGHVEQRRGVALEAVVVGEANDVVDLQALAGVEQLRSAKVPIPAQHDLHIRPVCAQPAHQQPQNGGSVMRAATVRRAQVAHQQMLAAEDVQRQKTVAAIKATEVTPGLLAVDEIVGGVEVQGQPLRGRVERGDELLDEHLVRRPHEPRITALLEPAQRRCRRQRHVP